MSSFKTNNYFQQLDALRGILSIIVFTTHLKLCSIYLAYASMHIFFILSTFLVSKSLLSDKRKDNCPDYNTKLFLLKRIGRIAPVYFLYLLILLAANILISFLSKESNSFLTDFKQFGWMHFCFIYNFRELIQLFSMQHYELISLMTPHLWSVSFEVQLYFMIFIFIFFFKKETIIRLTYFIIPFIILLRIGAYFLLQHYTSDQHLIVYLIQRNPIFHIDIIFYGFILVFVPLKNEKLIRYLLISTTILLFSIGFIFPYLTGKIQGITYADAIHQDKYIYAYHSIFYLDNLINIFTFLLVGYMINFRGRINLFNNKLLVRLGEYSYPTYIFQMLLIGIGYTAIGILIIIKIPKISTVLFYILSGVLMWNIAYYGSRFIHRKLELPLLRQKDNLIAWYETEHKQLNSDL